MCRYRSCPLRHETPKLELAEACQKAAGNVMECGDPRFAVQKNVRELRRTLPSQDSFEDESSIHHGSSRSAISSQNGTPASERIQRIHLTMARLLEQDFLEAVSLSESLADFRVLWQASRYTPNKAERTLIAAAFTEAGFLQLFEKVWQLNRGGLWCGGSLLLTATTSLVATVPNSMPDSLQSLDEESFISTDSSACGTHAPESVPSQTCSTATKGAGSSISSPCETRREADGSKSGQKTSDCFASSAEKPGVQMNLCEQHTRDTLKSDQLTSCSSKSSHQVAGVTSPGNQNCCSSERKAAPTSPGSVPTKLATAENVRTPSPRKEAVPEVHSVPSAASKSPSSVRASPVQAGVSPKRSSLDVSPSQTPAAGPLQDPSKDLSSSPVQQGSQTTAQSPKGSRAQKGAGQKSPLRDGGTSPKDALQESKVGVTEGRRADGSPQKETLGGSIPASISGLKPPPKDGLWDSVLAANGESVVQWKALRNCLTILWNCSDVNAELDGHLARSYLIPEFLQALRLLPPESIRGLYGDRKLYFVKALLGILHNMLRLHPESRGVVRAARGVETLQGILTFNPQTIKAKALIVLSYVVNEEEVNLIGATVDMISFLVHLLRESLQTEAHFSTKYGMCTSETLQALNNLSGNDANKIRIVDATSLPLFTQLLASGSETEQELSVLGLWSLSFASGNRRRLEEEPGCVEGLQNLTKCSNMAVCHAARGALWEIFHGGDISKSVSASGVVADTPHLMISYQWDAQPIMVKVKDKLKEAGYKVWMDVEHMTGSTLEAMALAVERAAVVLICMSEKYKESPSCRTESEYTFRLRKQIVPLRVQSRYVPDGWLGMLVGSKLYFDFSREELVEKNMPGLIRELGDRGRIAGLPSLCCNGESLQFAPISAKVSKPLQESGIPSCSRWGTNEVRDWLDKIGLGDYRDRFRSLNGALLMEMHNMRLNAPDFLFTTLRSDFNMNLGDILVLSRALSDLQ